MPHLAFAALVLVAGGCSSKSPANPFALLLTKAGPTKLSLDTELSPVAFRWLADDAVLIPPNVGERKLAAFGNFVGRAARKIDRVHLGVWDDETAWKQSTSGKDRGDTALAHQRAEFVKDTAGPQPVERYGVFDAAGDVAYQRDFRAYPISDLD